MAFPCLWRALLGVAILLAAPGLVHGETASFLAGGGTSSTGPLSQSFVVTTSDAQQIAQARAILAGTASRLCTGSNYRVRIRIAPAPGGDAVNRNYYAAGRPSWNWRATELIRFVFVDYATTPTGGPPADPVAPPDLPDGFLHGFARADRRRSGGMDRALRGRG